MSTACNMCCVGRWVKMWFLLVASLHGLTDLTCRVCCCGDAFRTGLGSILRGLTFFMQPTSAMWHGLETPNPQG